MSKYAEQIARIDERTGAMLKHLEKLNSSQGKHGERINTNEKDIEGLKQKTSLIAGINVALAGIASWIGLQR